MWFALHIIMGLFSLMAMCQLEKRLCSQYIILALFIFDGIVLVWSQVVYFQAQRFNCQLEMADVYFWLMGEILFFYCLTAFIMCYFFRRFCQDPTLRKKLADEEAAAEAEALEEANAEALNTTTDIETAPAATKKKAEGPGVKSPKKK